MAKTKPTPTPALIKPQHIKSRWFQKKSKSQKQASELLHSELYGKQKIHATNLAAYKQAKYALVVDQKKKELEALEAKKKLSLVNRILWRKTRAQRGVNKANTKKLQYNRVAEVAIAKLKGVETLPTTNASGNPIKQRSLSNTLQALKQQYNQKQQLEQKNQTALKESIAKKHEINSNVMRTHSQRQAAIEALKELRLNKGTTTEIIMAKTAIATADKSYQEAVNKYKSEDYKTLKKEIEIEGNRLKKTMKPTNLEGFSINSLKVIQKKKKEGEGMIKSRQLNNKTNLKVLIKESKHSSKKKILKYQQSPAKQEKLKGVKATAQNLMALIKARKPFSMSRSERKILRRGRTATAILNLLEKYKKQGTMTEIERSENEKARWKTGPTEGYANLPAGPLPGPGSGSGPDPGPRPRPEPEPEYKNLPAGPLPGPGSGSGPDPGPRPRPEPEPEYKNLPAGPAPAPGYIPRNSQGEYINLEKSSKNPEYIYLPGSGPTPAPALVPRSGPNPAPAPAPTSGSGPRVDDLIPKINSRKPIPAGLSANDYEKEYIDFDKLEEQIKGSQRRPPGQVEEGEGLYANTPAPAPKSEPLYK